MAKKPVKKSTKKTRPASRSTKKGENPSHWLKLGLVVLAITAACYLPTLGHDFVNWDDAVNITENPNLQHVGTGTPWSSSIADIFDLEKGAVIGNYNPLPILTFALEKSWNGGEWNPGLIHATNLILHLLTVFFVMQLLYAMGFGTWGVLTGGLLFGIHPMRVESVAWASERKDVLFAMFFFWALLYYVQWLKKGEKGIPRQRSYLIMILLALLSCLSKVQAVSLPLSMLALDYWFRRPMHFKLIWEKTPFWLLSLAFGLINIYTLQVQGSTDDSVLNFNFLDKLCIGAYSYCIYLYKLILPYPMSPLYSYSKTLPWTVYAAPVWFAMLFFTIVRAWKNEKRVWVFGFLFFTVNILFVLQVFAAGQGFMADRFTYVAYFGLFAIIAYYFDTFSKKENSKGKIYAALGLITIVFGLWTIRQIRIWKDGETLWTHVINMKEANKEFSTLPYANRGKYRLQTSGNYQGALEDFTRAIELAPSKPEYLINSGKTYLKMATSAQDISQNRSLLEKAIRDYTDALSKQQITQGSKSDALVGRGTAYGMAGMYEACIRDISEGVRLDPANKTAYANRSNAYLQTGQYEKALADYQAYLKIDPKDPKFWYECGMVQRSLNRNEAAIISLDNALQLNPKLGLAYLERARAKAGLGRSGVREDYQKAKLLGVKLAPIDEQMMNDE